MDEVLSLMWRDGGTWRCNAITVNMKAIARRICLSMLKQNTLLALDTLVKLVGHFAKHFLLTEAT